MRTLSRHRRAGAAISVALTTAALLAGVPHHQFDPTTAAPCDRSGAISVEVTDALARSHQPDVVVRTTKDGAPNVAARLTAAGRSVATVLPGLDLITGRLDRTALATLSRDCQVVSVTVDGTARLTGVDVPTQVAVQDVGYAHAVGATALHQQGIDGAGVGVALVDTGVDQHPGLGQRVHEGVDLTAEADGRDRYGHGTFVAGIVAADGTATGVTGVAPGAHLVPVKVAGVDGVTQVSHLLAAIEWVVDHRDEHAIGVLNLPLGTDSSRSFVVDPLNHAVQRAWDAGIVVVVSASNSGPGAHTIGKPGDDPWVITVGALDRRGSATTSDDAIPGWSGRGPTHGHAIPKPDLVAPGVGIVSLRAPGSTVDAANPEARVGAGGFRGSGSSFATAVTSGAVALLRQAHPDWTPDQVKGALLATAAPGPTGDRLTEGHGRLDVAAAHEHADPPTANGRMGQGAATHPRTAPRLRQADQHASQWYASQWYASQWYASQWYASQWYGQDWS
ncbi:MAG TPA: S8 family peptidase [Nitriliruptorales bacterium]